MTKKEGRNISWTTFNLFPLSFFNGQGHKGEQRGDNFSKVTHFGSEGFGTSAQPGLH